jgi:hypothetical protein
MTHKEIIQEFIKTVTGIDKLELPKMPNEINKNMAEYLYNFVDIHLIENEFEPEPEPEYNIYKVRRTQTTYQDIYVAVSSKDHLDNCLDDIEIDTKEHIESTDTEICGHIEPNEYFLPKYCEVLKPDGSIEYSVLTKNIKLKKD